MTSLAAAAALFNLMFFGFMLVVGGLVTCWPGLRAHIVSQSDRPESEVEQQAFVMSIIGMVGVLFEIGRLNA